MAPEIVLVTGGVKSGKSSWALQYAEEKGIKRAFIATATALDEEMRQKIRAHRMERADRWTTIEESLNVAGLVDKESGRFDVMLIDCLTLWVSNMLTIYNMTRDAVCQEAAKLKTALLKSPSRIILVTNEVNMGIMPADRVSRLYQDLLGSLNREIAGVATQVCFMVCGIAQKIK